MKATRGIFGRKPKATSEARPEAKNPKGRRPRGFLAEDVAKGLPEENPKGAFNLPVGPRA